MDTLTSLIRERVVTLTVIGDASKPSGWGHPTNDYRVRLSCDGRRMDLDFYQGLGIKTAPTADDVLSCLLMDASTVEDAVDFDGWAEELGFDMDTAADRRKTRASYSATVRNTIRLRRVLGDDFDQFMSANNDV